MAGRKVVITEFEVFHFLRTVFLSIPSFILMLSPLVTSYFACSYVSVSVSKTVLNFLLSPVSQHSTNAGIVWFTKVIFSLKPICELNIHK